MLNSEQDSKRASKPSPDVSAPPRGRGLSGNESTLGKMGRRMDCSLAAGTLPALAILPCGHRCLPLLWILFLVVCRIPTDLFNRVLAFEAQLCVRRPVVAHEFPCCVLPLALSVVFPCHLCSHHTHTHDGPGLPLCDPEPRLTRIPDLLGAGLGLSCLGSTFWSSLKAPTPAFPSLTPRFLPLTPLRCQLGGSGAPSTGPRIDAA